MRLLSSLLAMSVKQREFRFVPYDGTVDSIETEKGRPTVSCDGKIPGTQLDLTHWNGNETPDKYYADTSTEIALNFVQDEDDVMLDDALFLNNHYDTDGVLSAWTCLEPSQAQQYRQLLIAGAEAGDFGEWTTDLGVKLNSILANMCTDDEEASFFAALDALPHILHDLEATGGASYQSAWEHELRQAQNDLRDLQEGRASLFRGAGKTAILEERDHDISPFALHRALQEAGLWEDTTRIIRQGENKIHYEKIGHGWVKKLVKRPMVPDAIADDIVNKLNKVRSENWTSGGSSLVAICQATGPVLSSNKLVTLSEEMLLADAGAC